MSALELGCSLCPVLCPPWRSNFEIWAKVTRHFLPHLSLCKVWWYWKLACWLRIRSHCLCLSTLNINAILSWVGVMLLDVRIVFESEGSLMRGLGYEKTWLLNMVAERRNKTASWSSSLYRTCSMLTCVFYLCKIDSGYLHTFMFSSNGQEAMLSVLTVRFI